jgi:hypothetical protein
VFGRVFGNLALVLAFATARNMEAEEKGRESKKLLGATKWCVSKGLLWHWCRSRTPLEKADICQISMSVYRPILGHRQ